ncbi:hypothetical protein ACC705_18520 [Rhizobium ruizarguesonis]
MLDKSKNAIAALKRAKSVSNVIAESLEEIRKQIDDLKSAREDISRLPVAEEYAVSRAVQSVTMSIATAQQEVRSPSDFTLPPGSWQNQYTPRQDFGALVLAYLGDQIVEAVTAQVRHAYEDRQGVSAEDREKLFTANDHEILAAELMEESIIRQAEEQGFAIERRIDADPRAVLAHGSALP